MLLDAFIGQVMEIFSKKPTSAEICVENVEGLRFAAETGKYDAIFNRLNASTADAH